jgi:hypothetical protein
VGGSRHFWVEVDLSLRILKPLHKRGAAGNDFSPMCSQEEGEGT